MYKLYAYHTAENDIEDEDTADEHQPGGLAVPMDSQWQSQHTNDMAQEEFQAAICGVGRLVADH